MKVEEEEKKMDVPAISHVTSAPYPYVHGNDNDCLDSVIVAGALANGFQGVTNAVHTGSVNGMKETSDAARDAITAQARDSATTLQAVERNGGETRANIDRNAIQASRDICDVRKEIADHHGQVLLEMSKQHCDIREAVRQEAAETRNLIQAQALDDANRRASDLQNELNILKLQTTINT